MGKLRFGIWDMFSAYEIAACKTPGEYYRRQIREAQWAEDNGFDYYFSIEHQNSDLGQLTSPAVFLGRWRRRPAGSGLA